MSRKKTLCQCIASDCASKVSRDPQTHEEVSGLYLTAGVLKTHQRAQLNWARARQNQVDAVDALAEKLIGVTIDQKELSDGFLTNLTSHDPVKDSDTNKVSTPLSEPYSDKSSSIIVQATSTQSSTASESNSLPSPLPSQSPSSSIPHEAIPVDTTSFSSRCRSQLESVGQQFRKLKGNLSKQEIRLTFGDVPDSDTPPALEFTSRGGSSNRSFLETKQKASLLIEEVDMVDIGLIKQTPVRAELRAARKAIVDEMEEYLRYLDAVLLEQWLRKERDSESQPDSSSEHTSPEPPVVVTSKFILRNLFEITPK